MVQHDVLVEEILLECAAVLAEPAPCTLGGDACEEVGGTFVEWTFVGACILGHVWKKEVEPLEVSRCVVGPRVEEVGDRWVDSDELGVVCDAEAVGGGAEGLGHGGHKGGNCAVSRIEDAEAAVLLDELEYGQSMAGDLVGSRVKEACEEASGLFINCGG